MAAAIAAAALFGCATPPPEASASRVAPAAPAIATPVFKPFSEISGRWRMVQSRVTFADGSSRANASTSQCSLEIKGDLVVALCSADGKLTRVVTRVNCPEGIQRERLCDAAVVENALRPDFVGHQSKVGYSLDGGKLTVSAYPGARPGPEKLPVSVVSVLVRD